MTQDPKVQALIDAGKALDTELSLASCGKLNAHVEVWGTFQKALAAFEPEPELEYVLPSIDAAPEALVSWYRSSDLRKAEWEELRELTRVPKKPKGREWWINIYPKDPAFYAHADRKTATKALSVGGETVLVREVIGDTP